MSESDRNEGTETLADGSMWLSLSLVLNACAALIIAILILLPSPFGPDLIYENGKTYYEHYEAECREAEGERTTILETLKNPTTSEQRAKQHQQKAANELDITRECDMAAQYLAAESAASMDRSGWVTMIFTVIGALLIGGTLWFTHATLKEASKTTKAANDTVRATRKNSERELRAYVCIRNPRFSGFFDLSKPAKLTATVNNIGSTPAKNCRVDFEFFVDLGGKNILTVRALDTIDFGVLFPTQKVDLFHEIDMENLAQRLTSLNLEEGQFVDHIFSGCVRYEDINEKTRRTDFRFVMEKPAIDKPALNFSICATGNDYT